MHKDLLGDDDDAGTTTPLHDQSAEIGNVSNQLRSTNRSLDTTKAERGAIEQTLANQAAQLSALQTQLSSAKAAYETETKLLSTLRERYSSQTAEIQKAREELIRGESDLSAVRVEKAEVEGSFLRDKEEARDLHRKMIEVGQQVESMKTDVEKAKKEAKQQKGRLAIARKQLSSKEAERLKAEKELEEANGEVAAVTQEREEAEAELAKVPSTMLSTSPDRAQSPVDSLSFAADHALPVTPDPSSPMATGSGIGKSNNPFERLAMSPAASSPRSQSPFLPFTSTSVPTPSVPANMLSTKTSTATADDPFGFAQAFETEEPAVFHDDHTKVAEASTAEAEVSTPKANRAEMSIPHGTTDTAASPTTPTESELYTTPPTTAARSSLDHTPASQNLPTNALEQFPALDDPASKFPPLETNLPGHFQIGEDHHDKEGETDLGAQLKDLEVDESDSDSDIDDDEIPLAELAKGKTAEDKPRSDKESTRTPNENTTPGNVAFDEIFGQSTESPAVKLASPPDPQQGLTSSGNQSLASETPKDVFGAPAVQARSPFEPAGGSFPSPSIEAVLEPNKLMPPSTVAGVNAFDEAMGKIPSNSNSPTTQTMFDTAFDDNFDFASAAETKFPPAPTSVNGNSSTTSPLALKNDGFDSIFASPTNNGAPSLPARETPKSVSFADGLASGPATTQPSASQTTNNQPNQVNQGISFDEAFQGFELSDPIQLDTSFGSRSSKTSVNAQPQGSGEPPKPFSAASSRSSPKGGPSSPRVSSMRSASPPPRERTPPLRISSPTRRRPSTSSSSKELSHEKPKDPPTRHSKLSVRSLLFLD